MQTLGERPATDKCNQTSVTLEGIDNVRDFVENLDRIEPPGQMISFLTDPLLQKYVELRDSPIISQRIRIWLETCLEDQYNATKEGVVDTRYLSEILEGLLRHVQYTKVSLVSSDPIRSHTHFFLDPTANSAHVSQRVPACLGRAAEY